MITAQLVPFDERFLPQFIALNRQWIEKYFVLEPMDLFQLEQAQKAILNPGGEIFFVLEDQMPVGTVAMVPHGSKEYELAKMAVEPRCQGKGYGDLLMKTAIEWAREKKASKIVILSNTILEPAISLYRKYGFKTVRLGDHPDYKRCNIEMELML